MLKIIDVTRLVPSEPRRVSEELLVLWILQASHSGDPRLPPILIVSALIVLVVPRFTVPELTLVLTLLPKSPNPKVDAVMVFVAVGQSEHTVPRRYIAVHVLGTGDVEGAGRVIVGEGT